MEKIGVYSYESIYNFKFDPGQRTQNAKQQLGKSVNNKIIDLNGGDNANEIITHQTSSCRGALSGAYTTASHKASLASLLPELLHSFTTTSFPWFRSRTICV